jgi:RanBP-type and C3HC4-type zinc finger-containing protein 1
MASRLNVKLLGKINTFDSSEKESDSGAASAPVAGPSNQKRGDIYEQLKNLDDALYVANQEEITCSMCKKNVWPGDGIILKECLHNFCM